MPTETTTPNLKTLNRAPDYCNDILNEEECAYLYIDDDKLTIDKTGKKRHDYNEVDYDEIDI